MLPNHITVINAAGDSVTFAQDRHVRLQDSFDLSGLSATINSLAHNGNGASYQSTKLDVRDFDIAFYIARNRESDSWIEGIRHELNKVLNPLKNPFRIEFQTKGGKEYFLEAELNGTPTFASGFEGSNKIWQKGLLQLTAHNPFIYEKEEVITEMATWLPLLEFPLETTSESQTWEDLGAKEWNELG